MPNEDDELRQIEVALEKALEARDYPRIREILKSRGLGVSEETAAYVAEERAFKASWGRDESAFDASKIEIKMTPEEWADWESMEIGPPAPCNDEPLSLSSLSPEMAAVLEGFRNNFVANMPARLENCIQQEDVGMLTMWLRTCGYRIFPRNLPREDEPSVDAPEPPGRS